MKISYDSDADAINIVVKKGEVDRTIKIDDYTLLDVDHNGSILSLEILFVKERNPDILKEFQIENMAFENL